MTRPAIGRVRSVKAEHRACGGHDARRNVVALAWWLGCQRYPRRQHMLGGLGADHEHAADARAVSSSMGP